MDYNTNINELIEALETEELVYSGQEIYKIDRSTYKFVVLFKNGQIFSVVSSVVSEIITLKELIQVHLKKHFALTSQYKDLLKLESGKRYTLLLMSDFGIGVHAIQITMEKSNVSKYAQYSDAIELIFKPKSKKNLRVIQFYGKKEFVVWEGWVTVDTEAFTRGEDTPFATVKRSKYPSFDRRFLTDAIASTPEKPLFTKLFN